MEKLKLAQFLAINKLRLERGNTLKSIVINPLKNILTIALGGGIGWQVFVKEKDWDFMIVMFIVGLLVVALDKYIDWLVGKFDQQKGFWKIEQKVNSQELNPFFSELKEKIDRIEEKIDGERFRKN